MDVLYIFGMWYMVLLTVHTMDFVYHGVCDLWGVTDANSTGISGCCFLVSRYQGKDVKDFVYMLLFYERIDSMYVRGDYCIFHIWR